MDGLLEAKSEPKWKFLLWAVHAVSKLLVRMDRSGGGGGEGE